MKKLAIAIALILSILVLMFIEYKYIILNLHPYIGEDDTVYIELFNRVDEYEADHISQ